MSAADVRVALVHLGCARNLIDSETILGRLGASGYVLAGSVADADVAVLNTCAFIGQAREESEGHIQELVAAKESGALKAVLVAGCLPERFRGEIVQRFPGVDAFIGLSDYRNIARVVEEVLKGRKVRPGAGGRPAGRQMEGARLLQTPPSYAYLRPSHGCDHECAFCIIPAIRGRQRSKPLETVVAEAGQLAARGVREAVLVAEDSTGYGTDLGASAPRLPELVEAVAGVAGLRWVRVMYAYPNAFPWRLAEVLREHPKVVEYLDIPIQHAATPVLKAMRRGGTGGSIRRLLDRLRAEVPGLTLRTTVLVGHPGEGESEFSELLAFLGEFRFERLGAFAFSPEAGTPALEAGPRCSPEVAEERLGAVMELQAGIHAQCQRERVGRELEVLLDGPGPETAAGAGPWMAGRTRADAPEVDGVVLVRDREARLRAGDMLAVRVTGAEGYDLIAEPVAAATA